MTTSSDIEHLRRSIPFTIDGQRFMTNHVRQRAAALLRLAGLDPVSFDLGQLEGTPPAVRTRRFDDNEMVTVQRGARFVSIRDSAPVA